MVKIIWRQFKNYKKTPISKKLKSFLFNSIIIISSNSTCEISVADEKYNRHFDPANRLEGFFKCFVFGENCPIFRKSFQKFNFIIWWVIGRNILIDECGHFFCDFGISCTQDQDAFSWVIHKIDNGFNIWFDEPKSCWRSFFWFLFGIKILPYLGWMPWNLKISIKSILSLNWHLRVKILHGWILRTFRKSWI